jgi:hypothetical protein
MSASDVPPRSDSTPVESKSKWVRLRDDFLNHPTQGIDFWETLNRLIVYVVEPMAGGHRWDDVSDSPEFQAAFDFVTERLLSLDGFRNVMEKYQASGSSLNPWQYMTNRVRYVLSEWRSDRRDKPSRRVMIDENIENRPATPSVPFDANNKGNTDGVDAYGLLSTRIDSLSKSQQAVLVLSLWPQTVMPAEWRVKYLPIVLDVGQQNELSRKETETRLAAVLVKYTADTEEITLRQNSLKQHDRLAELHAKQIAHYESHRHFDSQKRAMAVRLRELAASGELNEPTDTYTLLKCDCFVAVKKSSEAAVLAEFVHENIYDEPTAGRRVLKNRPLWFRRRFSLCCYKQKYHRRIWLNTSKELAARKPEDGSMSHADIAFVLNAKQGTCFSDLSRARSQLSKVLTGEDSTKEDAQQELSDERLQQVVCADLSPPAG